MGMLSRPAHAGGGFIVAFAMTTGRRGLKVGQVLASGPAELFWPRRAARWGVDVVTKDTAVVGALTWVIVRPQYGLVHVVEHEYERLNRRPQTGRRPTAKLVVALGIASNEVAGPAAPQPAAISDAVAMRPCELWRTGGKGRRQRLPRVADATRAGIPDAAVPTEPYCRRRRCPPPHPPACILAAAGLASAPPPRRMDWDGVVLRVWRPLRSLPFPLWVDASGKRTWGVKGAGQGWCPLNTVWRSPPPDGTGCCDVAI